MGNRFSKFAAVVAAGAVFGVSTSAAIAEHGAGSNATLQVVISGIPHGQQAEVTVKGPHGIHRTIIGGSKRVTLTGLPAGKYHLTAKQFVISSSRRFPGGGTGFALPSTFTAVLRAHHKTTVDVTYGNVISGKIRGTTSRPSRVIGSSSNPTALELPASANVQKGQIVYYPPSAQFPDGVFAIATDVSRQGGNEVVTLKPASLTDAFPEIDVTETIPVGNPPGGAIDPFTGGPIAHIADLTVSLSNGPFECGTSGGTLGLPLSLSPTLDAEIHRPLFGSLTVKFVIGLTGSVGFNMSLPGGTSCDVEFGKAGPWPIGDIPIGPIQIPVEAEVSGKASVSLEGALNVNANASLTTHVGFTYDNGLHGVFDATPSGSASVTWGGGSLEVGPELKISAGLADALDANISAGLFDTLKGSGPSSYEVGVTFSADAGLEAEGIGSLSTNIVEKFFEISSYGVPGG